MKDEQPEERRSTGHWIAKYSIDHPVTVCMMFASLMVMGFVSLTRIPVVLTPDITFPFVEVFVPYPNATPGQVQEAIAKPVEEALSTVPNVQRMMSRSAADGAFVGLGLDWGTDVDWVRSEVREKVDQIRNELPSDVDRVMVQNWSTNDEPILGGRIASRRDLRNGYDYLEAKIKKRLERLPGVAEVQIWGAQRKEVDIYLRLNDVKRHRVDVGSLFRRLDNANLNVSLGKVVEQDRRYETITRGVIRSLDDIREFPVDGRGLRLHEIADIEYDKPITNNGRHLNGEYAVGLDVRKTSQANTVETVDRVMKAVEEINRELAGDGTEIKFYWNSATQIRKAIDGLMEAGTVGALLAVAVLLLYLRRIKATLVIGFAIPFSIVATIGFLYLFGKTLNVLSMMGLMLACGMLVDNAVVVLESIYQKLEKGMDRVQGAIEGTKEVVSAVFAATVSSIIIFVPLVFGKKTNYSIWLADTGASIMLALGCSLFISLTLIPLAVAKFLRFDVSQRNRFEQWVVNRLPRRVRPAESDGAPRRPVVRAYLRAVKWSLAHPFVVGFVVVPAIVAGSFVQLGKVPDNSPEAQDLQDLSIQYEFSENFHYVKVERQFVNPVERFLLDNRTKFKISDVTTWYSNNEAFTRVKFDKETVTLEDLKGIREQIGKGLPVIPGAEIKLGRQEGAESQNWMGINLYGEDPSRLQAIAREARQQLRQRKGFSEIHTDLEKGKEEVQIRLDRDLAKKYGISTQSVGALLSIVVRGQRIRGYRTSEGEVEIWMRLDAADRSSLEDLKSIVVGAGPNGEEIHLSQVAKLEVSKTPGVIQREDRRTYTWMFVNYSGDKKDEGKKIIGDVLNAMTFPPGYGWGFGFWTKRQESEDNEFLFNILFALAMVYFVMASLFESITHPFSIMLSLPFAMVGVVWTLLLTGTPFNLMAKIGLMVLVGVVVNNGIVLVDHVNNLRRSGMNRKQALLEGCRERFRPILMTASTTIVGLMPLAVGTSGVFELRYFPLARTVMGGLASSTVLTLIVLPVYYELFDDLAIWVKELWYGVRAPVAEAESQIAGD